METKDENEIATSDHELFFCNNCENDCDIKEKRKVPYTENEYICQECFEDTWEVCSDCGEYVERDDVQWANDDVLCQGCYDENYFYCEACDRTYHNDNYGGDGYCENCYESDDDDNTGHNRNYHKGDDYVEIGKRPFACEIECYYNDHDDLESIATKLPDAIGVTDDGSLGSYGKEFITPKLSGEKGENLLKETCKILNEHNCYVDKSCGLHVHLDTSDIAGNMEKIKMLILFYLMFEPVLYSFLPYSRRANHYCMPLSQFYQENEIVRCNTLQEFEALWYREQDPKQIENRKNHKYDNSRYAGTNFHSLLSNGHIELRHHSGTIDYKKIINWAKLHSIILDCVANGTLSQEKILQVKYLLQLNKKQEKFFEMLGVSKDDEMFKYFVARAKKFGGATEEETICVE